MLFMTKQNVSKTLYQMGYHYVLDPQSTKASFVQLCLARSVTSTFSHRLEFLSPLINPGSEQLLCSM